LETLEEISEENKAIFIQSGGKDFRYIPCLNDSDAHIALLKTLSESLIH
jgi:ferrochelatase